MKISVKFLGETKNIEIREDAKASDVLAGIKVNPETVLIKRGSEVIMEDETLADGEKIEIIRIVSGG